MKIKSTTLAIISAITLAGCGTTGGVLKMGPDTYRVSASKHGLSGGGPIAESNALQTADAYCTKLGKQLLVTRTGSDFQRPFYTSTVTFQCLSEGDRDLRRPSYSQDPTVIIEDRRK